MNEMTPADWNVLSSSHDSFFSFLNNLLNVSNIFRSTKTNFGVFSKITKEREREKREIECII